MEFQAIHLSRKEQRRFLEIANGDTTAKNNPEEDALFRKDLVTESMMAFFDLENNTSRIDMRAVTLSDNGKKYFEWYMNERARQRKEGWRFWLSIAVAVAGIVISAYFAMR